MMNASFPRIGGLGQGISQLALRNNISENTLAQNGKTDDTPLLEAV